MMCSQQRKHSREVLPGSKVVNWAFKSLLLMGAHCILDEGLEWASTVSLIKQELNFYFPFLHMISVTSTPI
jgi:hypothetical protein